LIVCFERGSFVDSNIKVSVIVPTYNRAHTIRRCLDSALGQTISPYEVIVVDDASTDDTTSVVKSISDERLRLITMPSNKGAQAARNVGIKNAKGDYIAFLDSDDEWVPEKLEWQIKEIARMGKPCVVHGASWIYKEKENTRENYSIPKLNGFVYKELLAKPGPCYPCLFVPKKNLVEIGFLDERTPSHQEWDISIALAKQLDFVFIDKPLMIYHIHGGDSISKDRIKEAEGWQYIVEKYRAEILKNMGAKVLAQHYRQIATFYLNAGERQRACKFFYLAYINNRADVRLLGHAILALSGRKIFHIAYQAWRRMKSLV
jgi:glycosyltransferase involved in cell wall biosynthesis